MACSPALARPAPAACLHAGDRCLAFGTGGSWLAPERSIRVHGDCHLGNMLGRDEAFGLVDFDDCLMAPAVQDIWMLLTGQEEGECRCSSPR